MEQKERLARATVMGLFFFLVCVLLIPQSFCHCYFVSLLVDSPVKVCAWYFFLFLFFQYIKLQSHFSSFTLLICVPRVDL